MNSWAQEPYTYHTIRPSFYLKSMSVICYKHIKINNETLYFSLSFCKWRYNISNIFKKKKNFGPRVLPLLFFEKARVSLNKLY